MRVPLSLPSAESLVTHRCRRTIYKVLIITAAVTLLMTGIRPVAARAADCLEYEPSAVQLTGTIRRQEFPGPPDYQSVADGDAPEVYWVLELGQPICVAAKQGAIADQYPVVEKSDRIQLVFSRIENAYAQYKHLVGMRATATGTLFHQQTGHHHTKVLLEVEGLLQAQ